MVGYLLEMFNFEIQLTNKFLHEKMKIILSLGLALVLFSCGDKSIRNMKANELLESYVATHNSVVAYGAMDYKQILDKSDAYNIPLTGGILHTTLDTLNLALPEDARLFFAVDNTDTTDAMPADGGIILIDVKDKDLLAKQIVAMSLQTCLKMKICLFL